MEIFSLFKEKLAAAKSDLETRIGRLRRQKSFGDDVDSFEEDADETEQLSDDLGVKEKLENRLARVEKALKKIEEGRYGKCESCGSPIEQKLLDVDPESELCMACKKKSRR